VKRRKRCKGFSDVAGSGDLSVCLAARFRTHAAVVQFSSHGDTPSESNAGTEPRLALLPELRRRGD